MVRLGQHGCHFAGGHIKNNYIRGRRKTYVVVDPPRDEVSLAAIESSEAIENGITDMGGDG